MMRRKHDDVLQHVSVRVTDEQDQQLAEIAKKNGISKAALVSRIVTDALADDVPAPKPAAGHALLLSKYIDLMALHGHLEYACAQLLEMNRAALARYTLAVKMGKEITLPEPYPSKLTGLISWLESLPHPSEVNGLLQRAINALGPRGGGSMAAVAHAIGVTPQRLSIWHTRPPERHKLDVIAALGRLAQRGEI